MIQVENPLIQVLNILIQLSYLPCSTLKTGLGRSHARLWVLALWDHIHKLSYWPVKVHMVPGQEGLEKFQPQSQAIGTSLTYDPWLLWASPDCLLSNKQISKETSKQDKLLGLFLLVSEFLLGAMLSLPDLIFSEGHPVHVTRFGMSG